MMHWLLQNNGVEKMTGPVAQYLRLMEIPFTDFSLIQELPDIIFDPDEKYFFYGSTHLHHLACQTPAWGHCTLDGETNFDQRVWIQNRGYDMLNHNIEVKTFDEFLNQLTDAPIFVRPIVDQKAFTGAVIVDKEVSSLYLNRKGHKKKLDPDMLVAVSSVHEVVNEYRFIVVNNQIVAGSSYRLNGQQARTQNIDSDIRAIATEFAKGWMPYPICVMDVGKKANGSFAIVEFNGIHGSGLYAIPPSQFIQIIENYMTK